MIQDYLRELLAINRIILSTSHPRRSLPFVVEKTANLTRADICLLLLGKPGTLAEVAAAIGVGPEALSRLKLPLDENLLSCLAEALRLPPEGAFLAVPVLSQGKLKGVLAIYRHPGGQTGLPEEEHILSVLADQVALVLERSARYETLRRKLHAHETLTERIFSSAPLGFFVLDANLVCTEVNTTGTELLKCPREEILGRPIGESLESARDALLPLLYRALSGETIHLSRFYFPGHARAPEAYWDGFLELIEQEEQALLMILWDVTERVQARERELFLARASEILGASLDYEQTLQELAQLAVPRLADWCLIDLVKGGVLEQAVCAHIDPEKRELARELARRTLKEPSPRHGVKHVLDTGRAEIFPSDHDTDTAPGAEHPALFRELGARSYMCLPLRARGRTIGVLSLLSTRPEKRYGRADLEFAEEFARRAALAIENASLYLQAREAIQMRDEVIAIASHDLKNPLGAIVLSADLLRRLDIPEPYGSKIRKATEVIRSAAARMKHLAGDLTTLASIQAGRFSPERRTQEVAPLFRALSSVVEPLAGQKSITVTTHILSPHIPPVFCDPERILQVLLNLVGNAIKFTPHGGCIQVSAQLQRDEIHFAVKDNGGGIDPQDIPRIFDRYWKGRRSGQKGTGLGLYIAKKIVDAHGGNIWVESNLGSGSTFFFTLPRLWPAESHPTEP